jgi:hypothetical protein
MLEKTKSTKNDYNIETEDMMDIDPFGMYPC